MDSIFVFDSIDPTTQEVFAKLFVLLIFAALALAALLIIGGVTQSLLYEWRVWRSKKIILGAAQSGMTLSDFLAIAESHKYEYTLYGELEKYKPYFRGVINHALKAAEAKKKGFSLADYLRSIGRDPLLYYSDEREYRPIFTDNAIP